MSGIDTISITPDPEHLMGKWKKNKKGGTEGTTECRRHERVESIRGVSFYPIVSPPPPPRRDFVLIFSASVFVYNGF